MAKSEHIEWLAVLRGLNILLVVMVHVYLVDNLTGQNHLFCVNLSLPFHPLRMPLFIFISGGLLYLTRIRKNIPIRSLYINKFQRIMIPFVFFVTVYYVLTVLFNQFLKTPLELSWTNFFESFIYFRNNPSQPFWFLAVLMFFMLMYPFFCYLCSSRKKMILFFIFSCIIYFIDTDLDSKWNILYIMELNHYIIYFFFGIFFFRCELYKYIESIISLVIFTFLYIVSYYYSVALLTSLIGIILMCNLCMYIARYLPSLFSSFRNYIFQIYLMSLPFQLFLEQILWKHLFYNESLFYMFYILDVLFGLFMPVLIAKLVERCNIRLIRLCFGLQ